MVTRNRIDPLQIKPHPPAEQAGVPDHAGCEAFGRTIFDQQDGTAKVAA